MLDARLPRGNMGLTKRPRLFRLPLPPLPPLIPRPLLLPGSHVAIPETGSDRPLAQDHLLLSALQVLSVDVSLHLAPVVELGHVVAQETGQPHHIVEVGVGEAVDDELDAGDAVGVIEFGGEDGDLVHDVDEAGAGGGQVLECQGLQRGRHRGKPVEFVGQKEEGGAFGAGGGGAVRDDGWVEGGGGEGRAEEGDVGFVFFLGFDEVGDGGLHGWVGWRHGLDEVNEVKNLGCDF
ncbi:hypothetical protein BDV97DRAFT_341171 [Delphinella strobiligena]|nr:hypothetical protein BDV97DRAFT_341171 [Delphinella strobiligena]